MKHSSHFCVKYFFHFFILLITLNLKESLRTFLKKEKINRIVCWFSIITTAFELKLTGGKGVVHWESGQEKTNEIKKN